MSNTRNHVSFILNDRIVKAENFSAALTLLDYLRLEKRLRGTKEGCAEGDCGACTVLVGRIANGELVYETVTSCIRFVGTLDACHVVTVEHLKSKEGNLHPVQQAMVDHHGSQCGFCTPGFVMSLYALWMANPQPSDLEVETALQGNLCRCTGYDSIIKAAQSISSIDHPKNDPLVKERAQIKKQLSAQQDGARVEIQSGSDLLIAPSNVDDLAEVRKDHPSSTIVAGSTDVGLWVTKHMHEISPVVSISHIPELREIEVTEAGINVGACVTYTELQPLIDQHFPQVSELWNRIGGQQVRNMGTIGGNVANGSPIGDTPPVLIALDATVTLRRGDNRRTLPIAEFFIDYGKQDRHEGDFVESIHVPFLEKEDHFAVYKISKRRDEDISAVCGAFRMKLENGAVQNMCVAYGGMAGTPKRATGVEHALTGKSWDADTIASAIPAFEQDFTPLSDWRASADYRMMSAKNLLRRFHMETTQGVANVRLQRELIGVTA
ncbi:MAG: xanthine dehydrogenase small subunit [Pseudomonadota bacterium]